MPKSLDHHILQIACGLTVLVGALAAGGAHPGTAEPWRLLFDVVQWPLDGHPAGIDGTAKVLSAVTGGLMVGWGALMWRLCRRPDPPYGDLLFGATAWFLIDSTGSLLAGVPGNVVLNVGFYGLFAVPLVRLRRRGAPT